MGYPKIKLISKRYYEKVFVNIYLTFYSELKDVSYNYRLQMGKPMIANKTPKISNSNPNLVKSMPFRLCNPLTRHIVVKNWCELVNSKGVPIMKLKHDWYIREPILLSTELLELLHEKY